MQVTLGTRQQARTWGRPSGRCALAHGSGGEPASRREQEASPEGPWVAGEQLSGQEPQQTRKEGAGEGPRGDSAGGRASAPT